MNSIKALPSHQLSGEITIPGDKSISHRAIMLAALANGSSKISHFLRSEDCLATLRAFQQMGIVIDDDGQTITVHGKGLHGLTAPTQAIDVGNAGTCIRLLSGVMAAQNFTSELVGDHSIMQRPMRRVVDPLALMGANISASTTGTPPLIIEPVNQLNAIDYRLPMASAQVKSCLLFAGMYAQGRTCITEPGLTRDHSERMLRAFAYPVNTQGKQISLQGGGQLQACDIHVPGDISSAAFFMVAASIAKQADITLKNVGINPTRDGVIRILRLMGADIELQNQRTQGSEPVADIRIRQAELHGIDIPENLVPLAIDEFPAIFIAAACAKGTTRLTGAKELRVKESDRIQAMRDGLQTLAIDASARIDGIEITGGQIQAGEIDSCGDHRIAMAFLIASVAATSSIVVNDVDNIATSFPNFPELASHLGMLLY